MDKIAERKSWQNTYYTGAAPLECSNRGSGCSGSHPALLRRQVHAGRLAAQGQDTDRELGDVWQRLLLVVLLSLAA